MTPNNGGLVLESQGRPPALCGGGGGGHVVGDNEDLKKGPWTAAEDQILMEYVKRHGEGNWNSVLRNSGLNRCGKSCRLRWVNHLRPHLKKGAFSPEEQRLILELHAKCGNKWAGMASQLPGRTDNEIKNYWNTRVKKRHRQGLPLYPHDISQFHSQSHSHSHFDSQPSTTPTFSLQTQSPTQAHNYHLPPLSPTPHQPKPISTLTSFPLFDPINTNTSSSFSSSSSSFTFHRPPPIIGAPLGYKRYRDSVGFSPPISPNPQRSSSILRTCSMPDIASFQLNDTNQMSNTASFQLNDTNQMSDIASFQLNNVTSMFDIGSFQLNGTSSIPDIASFQLNNISSTSGIEFLALTNTSSMSDIASFQFNDTNSTPYIGSFQFSHTLNPSLPQMPQTHLEYSDSLLLPNSNQVFQTQSEITIDTKVGLARMGTTVAADDTHSSKGLLDDLLQEVDVLACGDGNNNSIRSAPSVLGSFEDNHVLDGYDHWLQSTSSMESSLLDEVLYASC